MTPGIQLALHAARFRYQEAGTCLHVATLARAAAHRALGQAKATYEAAGQPRLPSSLAWALSHAADNLMDTDGLLRVATAAHAHAERGLAQLARTLPL